MTVALVSGGPDTFGPILSGRAVEQACMERLRAWSYVYVAEMERQTDREPGALPQVRGFLYANEFEKWPEHQLPALLLVSAGLADTEPAKDGRAEWRAIWRIGFACICSASTSDATSELARVYAAAHRALLLQHPPEGCWGITWMDESYEDLPQIDGRSMASGQVIFDVTYRAVTAYRGPAEPPLPDPISPADPDPPPVPPYSEPRVGAVDVQVESEPIGGNT